MKERTKENRKVKRLGATEMHSNPGARHDNSKSEEITDKKNTLTKALAARQKMEASVVV